eukprot:TRINITY_DN17982_c0_g1_i1.p3 TRINITY_DN17982_c0_g1~~TRINITY_DN17982_c0_g1_i1.p3  ORF type:complete len:131 (+),score=23.80 TRINITY_DN17982_c0_g1_i1:263-655(+)
MELQICIDFLVIQKQYQTLNFQQLSKQTQKYNNYGFSNFMYYLTGTQEKQNLMTKAKEVLYSKKKQRKIAKFPKIKLPLITEKPYEEQFKPKYKQQYPKQNKKIFQQQYYILPRSSYYKKAINDNQFKLH